MVKHATTAAMAVFGALAAAQDYLNTPNPRVDISTCEDLPCDPTGDNICVQNNDNNDDDARPGVGIVPTALRLGPAEVSLVLISSNLSDSSDVTDAERPASLYSSTGLHLFAGIDPSLADSDYPEGCLLMLQYQGQTFPIPDEEVRPAGIENTTSCQGILESDCRADIYDAIQSFSRSSSQNSSNSTEDGDDNDGQNQQNQAQTCQALADHVTTSLSRNLLCGNTLIASMIRATGGPLPGGDTAIASAPPLKDVNECKPMLPQKFNMYPVVDTQTWALTSDGGGDGGDSGNEDRGSLMQMFGGRRGYTPVFSLRFTSDDSENDSDVEVQLVCMRTRTPSGEVLGSSDAQEEASASAGARSCAWAVAFVTVLFTVLMA